MLTTLIAATHLVATAPQHPTYPAWISIESRHLMQELDVVAIVTPAAEPVAVNRSLVLPRYEGFPERDEGPFTKYYLRETLRVLDSHKKGTEESLQVVFPRKDVGGIRITDGLEVIQPKEDWDALESGVNYVLLGAERRADSDWFEVTLAQKDFPIWRYLSAGEGDDYVAYLAIPTSHEKLPEGFEGADLVTAALVDCMDGADDAIYSQIVELVAIVPPETDLRPSQLFRDSSDPGYNHALSPLDNREMIEFCPADNSVATLLKSKLIAATPYQQSKIWELLLRWRVPGSLKPYIDSIRYLMKLPGAYESVPSLPTRNSGLIDKLYEYTDLDGRAFYEEMDNNTYIDIAISATNPTLLLYWLPRGGGRYLTEAQWTRLAQLLDRPDPRVVHKLMEMLAYALKEPDGRPKSPTRFNNELSYPGLEETRLFWKRRLGLTDIPPRQ